MLPFFPSRISSTVTKESTMARMNKFVLSLVLFFSVLALSACASKPKEAPVAEPAQSTTVTEQVTTSEPAPAPAPSSEVAEQQASAPVAMAEQPAPKQEVKKARKKAAKARIVPKVVEPAPVAAPKPVAAPAPVVQQTAPAAAPPEPAPAPEVAVPVQQEAAPGFLEKYWLWLLGVVIAASAFLWMKMKK